VALFLLSASILPDDNSTGLERSKASKASRRGNLYPPPLHNSLNVRLLLLSGDFSRAAFPTIHQVRAVNGYRLGPSRPLLQI